jgi:hypothetical protein
MALQFAEQIKSEESQLAQATDPASRSHLETSIKEMKLAAEGGQRVRDALRAREADLSSRLRSEQATLDGLNDRLNQIERTLSQ